MHILITRRLTLRPPVPLDAEDIAQWLSDWMLARQLMHVPFPYGQTDATDWISNLCNDTDATVYTVHRERLIGVVSIQGEGSEPELSYWLAPAWRGNGFMTEAAQAVIRQAFATRNMVAVRSSVPVDNPASLNVQRKLGFEVCGGGSMWSMPRNEMLGIVRTRLSRTAFEGKQVLPKGTGAFAAFAPQLRPRQARDRL